MDEQQFNEHYNGHHARLIGYLRMEVRQDADDITQEVYVKAWKKRHTYDQSRPFGPWLFTIARNTAVNRKKKRKLPLGCVEAPMEATVRIHGDDQEELRAVFAGKLLVIEQFILKESVIEGRSSRDLAPECGMGYVMVTKVKKRALEKLRERLSA